MSITAEELAALFPGYFPILEQLSGGLAQCKEVLADSHFFSLREASYFFSERDGVIHHLIGVIETMESHVKQAYVLQLIYNQADEAHFNEAIERVERAGHTFTDEQYNALYDLHDLIHNHRIEDPLHGRRLAGSLTQHLERNPGNGYLYQIEPVAAPHIDRTQTFIKNVIFRITEAKINQSLQEEIDGLIITHELHRRHFQPFEANILAHLKHELTAIAQCDALSQQQKLNALHYRTHTAVTALGINPVTRPMTIRIRNALIATFNVLATRLHTLLQPPQPLENQQLCYFQFLENLDAVPQDADPILQVGLTEVLAAYQQYINLPAIADDAIVMAEPENEPAPAIDHADVIAMTAQVDAAIESAKEGAGFATATARARHMAFNNDDISYECLLQYETGDTDAHYVVQRNETITVDSLNEHFVMTPNNAVSAKEPLREYIESKAERTEYGAGQFTLDNLIRDYERRHPRHHLTPQQIDRKLNDPRQWMHCVIRDIRTREPLIMLPVTERKLDLTELNRIMNLHRLKLPDNAGRLKAELATAQHIAILAALPVTCFCGNGIELINLFKPEMVTEQIVAQIDLTIDRIGLNKTGQLLSFLNQHNLHWDMLSTLPQECFDRIRDSDDILAGLQGSLQRMHDEAVAYIAHAQQHNKGLLNGLYRIFVYRDPAIDEQLQQRILIRDHLQRIMPHLMPAAPPAVAAM